MSEKAAQLIAGSILILAAAIPWTAGAVIGVDDIFDPFSRMRRLCQWSAAAIAVGGVALMIAGYRKPE